MSNEYREYEKACEHIRQDNKVLLSEFAAWLAQKGLSATTIHKHVSNTDFYVNEFLLYEDARDPASGVSSVGMFLGYWFIRKAMSASAASIRANASSLKRFYAFMQEKSLVSEEDVRQLHVTTKNGMPEWLARLRRYDDPEIEDPAEIWGY